MVRRALAFWSIVGCLVSWAGFLGDWHWTLDLASHFRPHFAVLLAVPSLLLLWWGPTWLALLCCASAALQAGTLVPFLWTPPATAAPVAEARAPLRLLLCNVHTGNRRYQDLRRWLLAENPDVVLLQETDRGWLEVLAPLASIWPHQLRVPRADNFGITLMCKLPPIDARVVAIGDAGVPSVVARLRDPGGGRFVLIGTHPLPPFGSRGSRLRDDQLRAVARVARTQAEPVVVLGDLNLTPWSPHFRRLLEVGGLRDSAEGRGLQPTWPAWLGFAGIPLDHCLVGPGIALYDRRVGPRLGSDHRGLVVDLAVR